MSSIGSEISKDTDTLSSSDSVSVTVLDRLADVVASSSSGKVSVTVLDRSVDAVA